MVVETIAGLGKAAGAIAETGKMVSVLEKLKSWIMVQPEAAAAELAAIVTEVMKAPSVVNEAVNKLLALIDEETPRLAALNAISNGTLKQAIDQERPHCHDIGLIADRHLSQWLQQSGVRGPDAQELEGLLLQLRDADSDLFMELTEFAVVIEAVARRAQQLVVAGQKAAALQLLAGVAPQLFAAQEQANALANRLTRMQIDFRCRALGLSPSGGSRS
jgi:hypothetical protein